MNNKIKIVSGGQTGVDRAALDAALELDFLCGGWCPKGRKSEDGVIDKKYPLLETPLDNYEQRTEWNVRDSAATLILTWGNPFGGTKLTVDIAEKLKRPLYIVDMEKTSSIPEIIAWIKQHKIYILNVAGPRASRSPKIYPEAYSFLKQFLKKILVVEN